MEDRSVKQDRLPSPSLRIPGELPFSVRGREGQVGVSIGPDLQPLQYSQRLGLLFHDPSVC